METDEKVQNSPERIIQNAKIGDVLDDSFDENDPFIFEMIEAASTVATSSGNTECGATGKAALDSSFIGASQIKRKLPSCGSVEFYSESSENKKIRNISPVEELFSDSKNSGDVSFSRCITMDNYQNVANVDNEEKSLECKTLSGFKSASGKDCFVSLKALEKAEHFFDAEDSRFIGVGEVPSGCSKTSDFPSKEEGCTVPAVVNLSVTSAETENEICGFSTAAGKRCTVNSASLAKAKELFNSASAEISSGSSVASAALKDSVENDDDQLNTVKSISSISEIVEENIETEHSLPGFVGFSTASGKKCSYSSEALEKARKLLSSVDTDESIPFSESVSQSCVESTSSTDKMLLSSSPSIDTNMMKISGMAVSKSESSFAKSVTGEKKYVPIRSESSMTKFKPHWNNEKKIKLFDVCQTPSPSGLSSRWRAGRSSTVMRDTPCTRPYVQIFPRGKLNRRFLYRTVQSELENLEVKHIDAADVSDSASSKSSSTKLNQMTIQPSRTTDAGGGKLFKLWKSKSKIPDYSKFRPKPKPQSCLSEDELLAMGVRESTLRVTRKTASEFYFTADYVNSEPNSEIIVADDVIVKVDHQGGISMDEIISADWYVFRGFCGSSDVDNKLLNDDWIRNHLQWIVLKLASLELQFPTCLAARCLNVDNVLLQLRYRYDRELEHAQRPLLRKILNRDYPATAPMILRVVEFENMDEECITVELTDGWYGINAKLDACLSDLAKSGRIQVGMKLFIINATLHGAEGGCEPLEAPCNVRLALTINGVRRARWWARLGYLRITKTPAFPISSLREGKVVAVKVILCRKYPPVYLEKYADGRSVMRNERCEEQISLRFAEEVDHLMEKMLERVVNDACEFDVDSKGGGIVEESAIHLCSSIDSARLGSFLSTTSSLEEIYNEDDAEHLLHLYNKCPDPERFQNMITSSQLNSILKYKNRLDEKRAEKLREMLERDMANLKARQQLRTVVPILKLRISDFDALKSGKSYILNIWRPDVDELDARLREGDAYSLYQLHATLSRSASGEIELNSEKNTRIVELNIRSACEQTLIEEKFQHRSVTLLGNLQRSDFQAAYDEVDIVGFVIDIASATDVDTVYLGDQEMNIVALKIPGGLQNFGWEKVLSVGNFIACQNLHYKRLSKARIPQLCATIVTVIKENPKQSNLSCSLTSLKAEVLKRPEFLNEARSAFKALLRGSSTRTSLNTSASSLHLHSSPSVNQQFKSPVV
ncbi:Breast cancer type 2 susceptibility -like protein [Trichinella nelsoni]|uniref:Breast cancer type 2 susceptibility-like protein n=1 Tax=Trichinella nelsoni TaxID=6336 RepID=A0A0V0S8M5_9BILA|nr:Breast cancer type 2 susceptibility -like protein [Trichinella nelsoni]